MSSQCPIQHIKTSLKDVPFQTFPADLDTVVPRDAL